MLEAFLVSAVSISLFALGIGVGAIIENRLARSQPLTAVEEYPAAEEHGYEYCQEQDFVRVDSPTPVDFEWMDPDETLEIPAYEKLTSTEV
jgi:hypothetical protein|tara:strand:- start:130 stop:402 length:273 start_codon:yes stop_codon:yes gene_type:complete